MPRGGAAQIAAALTAGPLASAERYAVGLRDFRPCGNDKYADGGMAFAESLRRNSGCVQSGACDVAAMVAPAVSQSAAGRLRRAGLHVVTVPASLGREVRRSQFGSTLDKVWLWGLTQWRRVAFFDADILVVSRSVDGIIYMGLPTDHWVAAIVYNRHQRHKFNTGVMALQPNATSVLELVQIFAYGGGYGRASFGRDSPILRAWAAGRVASLSTHFNSAPHQRLRGAVAIHFRHGWKPWFNAAAGGSEVRGMHTRVSINLGPAWQMWWWTFEDLHKRVFTTPADDAEWAARWGQTPLNTTGPRTHVWMMRGTGWEYVQPLRAKLEQQAAADAILAPAAGRTITMNLSEGGGMEDPNDTDATATLLPGQLAPRRGPRPGQAAAESGGRSMAVAAAAAAAAAVALASAARTPRRRLGTPCRRASPPPAMRPVDWWPLTADGPLGAARTAAHRPACAVEPTA
eukprot:TRINITY_DN2510_c0_g1_i2.p1 TRINITY_DN2510_c0_g1~~TRINITY_DN2510_c0_g1_i2.p1  ORF type:complete len:527 (+),score=107.19 TRINITY_DN2510_c0_g1_i2:203-1582(+)